MHLTREVVMVAQVPVDLLCLCVVKVDPQVQVDVNKDQVFN